MELAIGIVAAIVFGAIGFGIGRANGRTAGLAEGRAETDVRVRSLVSTVERGRLPEGGESGSAEASLRVALERGWAPKEVERQAALREAIGRVSGFLANRVREPLAGHDRSTHPAELRASIDRALGALEDLDFFVAEMSEAREGTDLSALAQGVAREFAADHDVGVRLMLEGAAVRADVHPTGLKDALYLVLHNASRFGDGSTIDLTVGQSGGRARIVVRDRGDGFSEEAFARAFDPFYSTSDEGLGLGLPHVRKVVEGMGGRIELRNVPDGGAEVEIAFAVG